MVCKKRYVETPVYVPNSASTGADARDTDSEEELTRPYLRSQQALLRVIEASIVRVCKFRKSISALMMLDEVKRDVARRQLGFVPKNEDIMTCIDTLVKKTYIDRDVEGENAQLRYV